MAFSTFCAIEALSHMLFGNLCLQSPAACFCFCQENQPRQIRKKHNHGTIGFLINKHVCMKERYHHGGDVVSSGKGAGDTPPWRSWSVCGFLLLRDEMELYFIFKTAQRYSEKEPR